MPPYPPECRAEAIRLARTSGKPHAEMARELGMTGETLRLWLKQADLDEGKRRDGLTSDEQEERRRLRRENRIVREERESLKQAAAFFAQETSSIRSSATSSWNVRRPITQSPGSAVCWASPPVAPGPGVTASRRRGRGLMRHSAGRWRRFTRRAVAPLACRGSRRNWPRRGCAGAASASRG